MTEYTTIVIKHESDKRPIHGFAEEVLGCEVVGLAIGNLVEKTSQMQGNDDMVLALEGIREAVKSEEPEDVIQLIDSHIDDIEEA